MCSLLMWFGRLLSLHLLLNRSFTGVHLYKWHKRILRCSRKLLVFLLIFTQVPIFLSYYIRETKRRSIICVIFYFFHNVTVVIISSLNFSSKISLIISYLRVLLRSVKPFPKFIYAVLYKRVLIHSYS